jgi:hypothetical protein
MVRSTAQFALSKGIGGITTGTKNPKVKKGYGIKANLKLLNTEHNRTDNTHTKKKVIKIITSPPPPPRSTYSNQSSKALDRVK